MRTEIYGRIARELARRDPAAALEWTGNLPENQKLEAGAHAFNEWQGHQYEAAMKWWDTLAKDERRSRFFKNTIQAIGYANSADKLGLLDRNEWPAARQIIANMNIPEDRKSNLLRTLTE